MKKDQREVDQLEENYFKLGRDKEVLDMAGGYYKGQNRTLFTGMEGNGDKRALWAQSKQGS